MNATRILVIDPGVHACACAEIYAGAFRVSGTPASGGDLIRVWFSSPGEIARAWGERGIRPNLVIVERPEYQGARSDAARTQDLLALAWAGARAAYSIGVPVREMTPTEWKGSEAKPPQHLRLWEDVLTEAERKLFAPDTGKRIMAAAERYALNPGKYPSAEAYGSAKGSEVHNLLDAAAMGLAFVGRFR